MYHKKQQIGRKWHPTQCWRHFDYENRDKIGGGARGFPNPGVVGREGNPVE